MNEKQQTAAAMLVGTLAAVSASCAEEPLLGATAIVSYEISVASLLQPPPDIGGLLDGGLLGDGGLLPDAGIPLPDAGGLLPDGGSLTLLDAGILLPDGGLALPIVRGQESICVWADVPEAEALQDAKLQAGFNLVRDPPGPLGEILDAQGKLLDLNLIHFATAEIYPEFPCDDPIPPREEKSMQARGRAVTVATTAGQLTTSSEVQRAHTALDWSRSTVAVHHGKEHASPATSGELVVHLPTPDQVVLSEVRLTSPQFLLGGHEVRDVAIVMQGKGTGVVDANGLFTLDGTIRFHVSSTLDGSRGGTVLGLARPIAGHLDRANRTITFQVNVDGAAEDGTAVAVDLNLVSSVLNNPPYASAATVVAECTSPAGATVTLDGSATFDPDGAQDLATARWFWLHADGVRPLGGGLAVSPVLPLGQHRLMLEVIDRSGSMSYAFIDAAVQDTTPPQLVWQGPSCLWPPQHDYAVLGIHEEVAGLVSDACDSNPSVDIASVTSNQPEDGVGDGDTVNDALLFEDRVCLRSERQGIDLEGRLYSVALAARDASGNQSALTTDIHVAHDLRVQSCQPLTPRQFVSEDDPICSPTSDGTLLPDEAQVQAQAQAGCAVAQAGSAGLPWALTGSLLGLLLLRRRKAGGGR